jgi:hypothetical protein
LAKAALVASAKAVLRTSAAQSAIFLVVNIALSFLISPLCSPPIATVKQNGSIAMLKQIVRLVDYSPSGLSQANWSIKAL